jgi:transcriptional regulator with XRE-family HTH domain
VAAETFAQRLKRLRDAAGLSQAKLAEAAGVPASTLRNWEYGRRVPYATTASALARALGVSTGELLDGLAESAEPAKAAPKKTTRGRKSK